MIIDMFRLKKKKKSDELMKREYSRLKGIYESR